jgi:hypothetical protein
MGLCLLGAVSRSSAEGTKTINQSSNHPLSFFPHDGITSGLPYYILSKLRYPMLCS